MDALTRNSYLSHDGKNSPFLFVPELPVQVPEMPSSHPYFCSCTLMLSSIYPVKLPDDVSPLDSNRPFTLLYFTSFLTLVRTPSQLVAL